MAGRDATLPRRTGRQGRDQGRSTCREQGSPSAGRPWTNHRPHPRQELTDSKRSTSRTLPQVFGASFPPMRTKRGNKVHRMEPAHRLARVMAVLPWIRPGTLHTAAGCPERSSRPAPEGFFVCRGDLLNRRWECPVLGRPSSCGTRPALGGPGGPVGRPGKGARGSWAPPWGQPEPIRRAAPSPARSIGFPSGAWGSLLGRFRGDSRGACIPWSDGAAWTRLRVDVVRRRRARGLAAC